MNAWTPSQVWGSPADRLRQAGEAGNRHSTTTQATYQHFPGLHTSFSRIYSFMNKKMQKSIIFHSERSRSIILFQRRTPFQIKKFNSMKLKSLIYLKELDQNRVQFIFQLKTISLPFSPCLIISLVQKYDVIAGRESWNLVKCLFQI